MAMGGCGDGALGDRPTLSGQIDGWDRGVSYTIQGRFPGNNRVVASGPIDFYGKFSLPLPEGAASASSFQMQHVGLEPPMGCSGSLTAMPQDFSIAQISLSAVSSNLTNPTAQILQGSGLSSSVSTVVNYLYVDRSVDITGEIDCPGRQNGTEKEIWDLHYKSGWNRSIISTITTQSPTTLKAYSGGVPDGVKWIAK